LIVSGFLAFDNPSCKIHCVVTRKNSAELIFDVTKESLSAQQAQKATLESKASTLTGFAAGMIALPLGFKDNIVSLPSIAKLMVITSIVLFLLSILLATIVGWVRKYRSDPNPQALAENYLDKDESKVKLQLISNLLGTWRNNSKQLEGNAILLRLAMLIQTTGFILLGAVLILFLM
jgi:hypothetical protein